MFASDKDLRKPLNKPKRPTRSSQVTSSSRATPRQASYSSSTKSTTKEINKDVNKVSKSSDKVCDSQDDIVNRTKRERAVREEMREQRRHVVAIQSWYRGRQEGQKWLKLQRIEFDNKLKDVEKVSLLLYKTKNIVLVPPINVSVSLLQKLLIGKFHKIDQMKLVRYCKSILNVSLSEIDQEKNIITYLTQSDDIVTNSKTKDHNKENVKCLFILNKLVQVIFNAIDGLSLLGERRKQASPGGDTEVSMEESKSILMTSLSLLLGLDAPFRIRLPDSLRIGFEKSRRSLLRYVVKDQDSKVCDEMCDNGDFFGYVRRSLYTIALRRGLLDPRVDDEKYIPAAHTATKCGVFDSSSSLADDLVDLCMRVILHQQGERNRVQQKEIENAFARNLLGTPLCTFLLTSQTLKRLASPAVLSRLLGLFKTPQSAEMIAHKVLSVLLPSSPQPVFTAGQWASGNIASLCPFLPISPELANHSDVKQSHDETYDVLSDELLTDYMDILNIFLVTYPIPGVLQGRNGVVWHRDGAVLNASGVPLGLQTQMLGVFDKTTCHSLYSRVLRPLPLPLSSRDWQSGNSEKVAASSRPGKYDRVPNISVEDVKDISAALKSSGIKLAQKDMKEHQAEHAASVSYFGLGVTSVWAKKLSKSLGGMLFGKKEKESGAALHMQLMQQQQLNSGSGKASSGGDNENTDCKRLLENEPPSLFPLNLNTVRSLCSLWSLLLPAAAAGASPNSAPWQALSGLCFSTRLVGRMWGFVLNSCAHAKSNFATTDHSTNRSDFQLTRDLVLPCLSSLKTVTASATIISSLAVLVAVLKIQLIALDDAELYDQEVRYIFQDPVYTLDVDYS